MNWNKIVSVLIVGGLFLIGKSVVAQDSIVVENAVLKILEERMIPCTYSGLVKQSVMTEGQRVSSNQPLMQIDDEMVGLEIEMLRKDLKMAESEARTTVDLDFAKRSIAVSQADLSRALRSNQRYPGAVPISEIDQLQLVVEQGIAEKDKIEFQLTLLEEAIHLKTLELKMGEKKLRDHQMYSPLNGIIVEVLKKQGEWVNESETIARIVRLDKLKTEVQIPVKVALSGIIGRTADFRITLDGSQKSFAGQVVYVHPEANPISSKVRILVEIENPDYELIAGLTGELEIHGTESAPSDIDPISQSTSILQD